MLLSRLCAGSLALLALGAAAPARADGINDVLRSTVNSGVQVTPPKIIPPAAPVAPEAPQPAAAAPAAPPAAAPAAAPPPQPQVAQPAAPAPTEQMAMPAAPAVAPAGQDLPPPGPVQADAPANAAAGGPDLAHVLSKDELRDLVEAATVYVVAEKTTKIGKKTSTKQWSGSGFFIAPDLIMTNSHVAGDADVIVVSIAGRGYVPAKVRSNSNVAKYGRDDFALLSIGDPLGDVTLAFGDPVRSLDTVYAAGYTGVITDEDKKSVDFFAGDASAVPDVVISTGTVQNVIVRADSGMEAVTHTALINHGNSGGPLLNACGQVVGVNTWIATDRATVMVGGKPLARNADGSGSVTAITSTGTGFAQSVDETRRFLKSRKVAVEVGPHCPG